MRRMLIGLGLLLSTAACGGPPPLRPLQPLPPPPLPLAAWTAQPQAALRTAAGTTAIPHLLTRLQPLGYDSLGWRVRCSGCAQPLEGWLPLDQVVTAAPPLAAAATGTIADFALAVREAAARRDVQALAQVMDPGFSFSFGMPTGRVEALGAWQQEGFRTLGELPALVDRGLVSRWEGTRTAERDELWVAPPEYLSHPGYLGLRTGFRRVDGRWRWTFLVRGD